MVQLAASTQTSNGASGSHSHDRTLLSSLGFSDPDKKNRRHDLACQYIQQNAKRIGEVLGLENGHPLTALTGVALEYHITKGEGKYRTTIGFADAMIDYEVGRQAPLKRWVFETSRFAPLEDHQAEIITAEIEALKARCETYRDDSDIFVSHEHRACIRVRCDEFSYKHAELPQSCTPALGPWEHLEQFIDRKWRILCSGHDEKYIDGVADTVSILCEVKINPVNMGDICRQLKLYREYCGTSYTALFTAFPITDADKKMLEGEKIRPMYLGKAFQAWCEEQEAFGSVAALEEL